MQSTCLGRYEGDDFAGQKILLPHRFCHHSGWWKKIPWWFSWHLLERKKHQDSKRCSSLQMICGSGSGSRPITLRSKSSTSSYRAPCFLRSLGWLDWDKFDSAPIIYSALTPEDMDTKFQKRQQTPKTLTACQHVNSGLVNPAWLIWGSPVLLKRYPMLRFNNGGFRVGWHYISIVPQLMLWWNLQNVPN